MEPKSRGIVLAAVRRGLRTVNAISEGTGLHPNTVRSQLTELVAARLVETGAGQPQGRGRPQTQFLPAGGMRASRPDGPWAELLDQATIDLLVSGFARPDAPTPAEASERGALLAQELPEPSQVAGAPGEFSDLVDTLDLLGFEPVADGEHITLRGCPVLRAAQPLPEIICALHAGLVRDRLVRSGGHWSAALQPFGPDGLCTLDLQPAGDKEGLTADTED